MTQERPYVMDTGWERGIHGDLDGEALYRWAKRLETQACSANEVLALVAEMHAINAAVAAIQAENACRAHHGECPAYGEEQLWQYNRDLNAIGQQIREYDERNPG